VSERNASAYTDWQERASEFQVGDGAFPKGEGSDTAGTVVAVYPAIGMVDVQHIDGTMRYPAEELHRWKDGKVVLPELEHDSVPGGVGQVSVPGGPGEKLAADPSKVALYWKEKDRQYHATRGECDSGALGCPKCKEPGLKKAIYKRREGASERLWGCPNCMFLIKDLDIHLHEGAG
jgi:hypothetical protein